MQKSGGRSGNVSQKTFSCTMVTLFVALLAIVAFFVTVFLNRYALNKAKFDENMLGEGELAEIMEQVAALKAEQATPNARYAAINATIRIIVQDLAQLSIQAPQLNRSINSLRQQAEINFLGDNTSFLTSCSALPASAEPGFYWIRNSFGSATPAFCNPAHTMCGGVRGPWRRLVSVNYTKDSNISCPADFREVIRPGPLRVCTRNLSTPGCSSVMYPIPNDIPTYSRVCGRIIGYQSSLTNAFAIIGLRPQIPTIDDPYLDGVSLTHGSPRKHIWSFAAALSKNNYGPESTCTCQDPLPEGREDERASPVAGDDYFCDSGLYRFFSTRRGLYDDDPLWDDAGCGATNTCCSFNNPPWFYKQLPQNTTDDIEMRLCRDEPASNENVSIETVDLFVM